MDKKEAFLNIDSCQYKTRISSKFENRKLYAPVNPKLILSYIPGTVLEIYVSPGQEVRKGDDLMILDAMKMKNKIKSNIDGRVKAVKVAKGTRAPKGTILIELE